MSETQHAAEGFAGKNDSFAEPAELLRDNVNEFVADCIALSKQPITEATQSDVAELVRREIKLRQTAEAQHKTDKAPFKAECDRLDAELRGTKNRLAGALETPQEKLRLHLIELDNQRKEAERIAREAAAMAAEQAEVVSDTAPEVAGELLYQAAEATRDADVLASSTTKVASKSGRGVGLKTVKAVKVVDWVAASALVINTPKVQEAVLAALTKLAKGGDFAMPLAGCVFTETQEISR